MKFKSVAAVALVTAGLIAAPLTPASANDGRHALFGIGAAVGALAILLLAPFGGGGRSNAPPQQSYAPPAAYYPPPVAYYPAPRVYYPPPGYAYGPPPGYYYQQR